MSAQPAWLEGTAALVVGASRGIGAASARALAEAGADVALAGRSRADLERLATELGEAGDRRAVPLALDAADAEAVEATVASAAAELGRLDILVNAAGTTVRAAAEELPLAEWDRILAVNLRAAFAASRAAARLMPEGGSIVNIASLSSQFGIRRGAAYGASKGGVAQLTKALALEWGPRGIRVNAIAPGYIETELTRGLQEDEARYESIRARIPLGRWGQPDDIGGTVALLCSPLARYLSGQVIYVDGGYTADG